MEREREPVNEQAEVVKRAEAASLPEQEKLWKGPQGPEPEKVLQETAESEPVAQREVDQHAKEGQGVAKRRPKEAAKEGNTRGAALSGSDCGQSDQSSLHEPDSEGGLSLEAEQGAEQRLAQGAGGTLESAAQAEEASTEKASGSGSEKGPAAVESWERPRKQSRQQKKKGQLARAQEQARQEAEDRALQETQGQKEVEFQNYYRQVADALGRLLDDEGNEASRLWLQRVRAECIRCGGPGAGQPGFEGPQRGPGCGKPVGVGVGRRLSRHSTV